MADSRAVARLQVVASNTVPCTCGMCEAKLTDDDLRSDDGRRTPNGRRICTECRKRPDARAYTTPAPKPSGAERAAPEPPAFTDSERSLIRNTYRFMGPEQLLDLLNDRLVADRGSAVARHTMMQVQKAISEIGLSARDVAQGAWSDVRRRLAHARRDGVLHGVTEQTVDDFAVVFGATAAQVLRLKDALSTDLQGDAT